MIFKLVRLAPVWNGLPLAVVGLLYGVHYYAFYSSLKTVPSGNLEKVLYK